MNINTIDQSEILPLEGKQLCLFFVFSDIKGIRRNESLGVGYLAATLRAAGYDARIINIGNDTDDLNAYLDMVNPIFIGLSILMSNIESAKYFGNITKIALPNCHICAGGSVATFATNTLLTEPEWAFIDSVVRGEAESIIVALVRSIIEKQLFLHLPGVFTRKKRVDVSISPPILNIDTLPFPARDELIQNIGQRPSVATIITHRGCTGQCTFCGTLKNVANENKHYKTLRLRKVSEIVQEIKSIQDKYGYDKFSLESSIFEDPGNTIGKQRIEELANLIINNELSIVYGVNSLSKTWSSEDSKLIDLLIDSGLNTIYFGFESASDRMLKLMKKNSTVSDNYRALQIFRSKGIFVQFGMITFHPLSEWKDIENNIDFLLEVSPHTIYCYFKRLELFPGTEIVTQLKNKNLVDEHFEQKLDQYAYKYANDDIQKYAECCSYLYNTKIFNDFRWEDFNYHILCSNIRRMLNKTKSSSSYLSASLDEYSQTCIMLPDINREFICQSIERARKGLFEINVNLLNKIKNQYSLALTKLRKNQMILRRNAYRESERNIIKVII